MTEEEIQKVVEIVEKEFPQTKRHALNRIFKENALSSGLEKYLQFFSKPEAWLSAFLGLYLSGELNEYAFLKMTMGVNIGAVVDSVSHVVRKRYNDSSTAGKKIFKSDTEYLISAPESAHVINDFAVGVINQLKNEGFSPAVRAEAVAMRVGMRNPMLRNLLT